MGNLDIILKAQDRKPVEICFKWMIKYTRDLEEQSLWWIHETEIIKKFILKNLAKRSLFCRAESCSEDEVLFSPNTNYRISKQEDHVVLPFPSQMGNRVPERAYNFLKCLRHLVNGKVVRLSTSVTGILSSIYFILSKHY